MERIVAQQSSREAFAHIAAGGTLPSIGAAHALMLDPSVFHGECQSASRRIHVMVAFELARKHHLEFEGWLPSVDPSEWRARAHDLAECIALVYSRDTDPSAPILPPSALSHASSCTDPVMSCRTSCGELLAALICAAFPSLPIAAPPNQVGWLLPLPPTLLPLKGATLLLAESSVQPLCPRLELQFSKTTKSSATATSASHPSSSNSSTAAAASLALLDHLWNWNGQMSVKYFPPVWAPASSAANRIADDVIAVVSESCDDDGEWALNSRAAQSARVAQLRTRLLQVAQRSPMVGPVRFRALASRHVENSLLKRQMIGASELGRMIEHARRVDGGADGIETAAVLASLVWQPLEARLFRDNLSLDTAARLVCTSVQESLARAFPAAELVEFVLLAVRKGSIAPSPRTDLDDSMDAGVASSSTSSSSSSSSSAMCKFLIPNWANISGLLLQYALVAASSNQADEFCKSALAALARHAETGARDALRQLDLGLLQNCINMAKLVQRVESLMIPSAPPRYHSWLSRVCCLPDSAQHEHECIWHNKRAMAAILISVTASASTDDFVSLWAHSRLLATPPHALHDKHSRFDALKEYSAVARTRMGELDPRGDLEWRLKVAEFGDQPRSLATDAKVLEAITSLRDTKQLPAWATEAFNFHRAARWEAEFVPALLRFRGEHGLDAAHARLVDHLAGRSMLSRAAANAFKQTLSARLESGFPAVAGVGTGMAAASSSVSSATVSFLSLSTSSSSSSSGNSECGSLWTMRRELFGRHVDALLLRFQHVIALDENACGVDAANSYKGLARTIGHAWSTAVSGADQWRVVSLIFDALCDAVDAAAPVFLDDARSAAARLFALTRLFAIVECVRKTRSAHLLLGVRIQRSLFAWAPANGLCLPGLVALLCSQQHQLESRSWNFQFTLTSAQNTTTPSILVLVDDWLTCSADAAALAFAERHALFSSVAFGSCVVILAPTLAFEWCGLCSAFDPLTACGVLTERQRNIVDRP